MFGYGTHRVSPTDRDFRDIERAARRGDVICIPKGERIGPSSHQTVTRLQTVHRADFVPASEVQALIAEYPSLSADGIGTLVLPANVVAFEMAPAPIDIATRRIVCARRKMGPLENSIVAFSYGAIDRGRWTVTVPFEFVGGGIILPSGIVLDDPDEPGTIGLMHEMYCTALGLRAIAERHQALPRSRPN